MSCIEQEIRAMAVASCLELLKHSVLDERHEKAGRVDKAIARTI